MVFRWPTHINGVVVPYGRSVPELQSLIMAGTAERWAAIAALAHSSDPNAVGCLGELASSRDPLIRRSAVDWIGRCPDGGTLSHIVVARLRDPDVVVQRSAVEVAGELAIREAHMGVVSLLESDSPSTRESALRTLETLWQETDFDVVVRIFKTDASERVRRTAGWTLHGTRSAERASALFALWHAHELPRHRVWACQVAAEFPQRGSSADLSRLEQDRDGHVRKAARRARKAIEQADSAR